VPQKIYFIGSTAPYIYDDQNKKGGIMPILDHVIQIAKIAEANPSVTGMGLA
jgi:hypothetical protein